MVVEEVVVDMEVVMEVDMEVVVMEVVVMEVVVDMEVDMEVEEVGMEDMGEEEDTVYGPGSFAPRKDVLNGGGYFSNFLYTR